MNNRETTRLLREVFPGDVKYNDQSYVDWLYGDSPSGVVVEANRDDESGRIGHYAVVPQRWWDSGREVKAVLSLNTAVSERARGMGLFTRLAEETYATAEEMGVAWVIGVANANSTPGFIRKLGFSLNGSLDARFHLGWSWSKPRVIKVGDADIIRDHLELTTKFRGAEEFERLWDVDELSWRLSNPIADYHTVRIGNCMVVATRSEFCGLPVCVILKIFVAGETSSVSMGRIARSVNRHLHGIACVYGGFNRRVLSTGWKIPERLRPSPLNLIVKGLGGQSRECRSLSVMEFLDFDAY